MQISSTVTVNSPQPYLAETRALGSVAAGFIPPTNASVKHASASAVTQRDIAAGTVGAKASDDTIHPCGLVELTEDSSGSDTILTVGATNQAAFNLGDEVTVTREQVNRDIAVTGEADDETFTATGGAHGLVVGQMVELVAGFTGGAGAAAGQYPVATVPTATTFTLVGVAFTTDISAGTVRVANANPTFTLITTTNRYVTAINEATGAITLSGANITALEGDLLVKTKAYKPCGFIDQAFSATQPMIAGSTTTLGAVTSIRHEGGVRSHLCVGLSELVKRALSGAPWIDPLTNQINQSQVAGFRFLNL